MTIAEVLPEPLPLVLDEAPDESLSSWLNRHAEFYGVSPSALNLRAGINTPSFARIDYWPTAGEACSIASAMRRSPEMILSMTHQPYHGPLATMIARGKPVLACPECQTIHRRDRRRDSPSQKLEPRLADHLPRLQFSLARNNRRQNLSPGQRLRPCLG